jgi:uncharacterized protein
MLSADLVIVHRRKQELVLPNLEGKSGDTVRHWAEQILDAARGSVGLPRQELAALVQVMGETQQARKLTRGLAKLLEDACDFQQADPELAAELRRDLFLRATETRRAASVAEPWDRQQLVRNVCQERGWDESTFDEQLYADLSGAQRLLRVPDWSSQQLFERYDEARVQAVLLRAVQVRVRYVRTSVLALRELFRQLKFRQLLHQSEREAETGLRLTIDGPMSLFESATKYGLQLALTLPALASVGPFELQADVRWGKGREVLQFTYGSKVAPSRQTAESSEDEAGSSTDEMRQLLADLASEDSPYSAAAATTLVDLPGVGLCVPDITFVDRQHPKRRVHFEMLGYWSRAAVWRRVELAEAGLPEPVVFGVNQRLRVSEEVLDKKVPAALYVFRGQPNAKTLLARVEEVARRRWP